MYGKQTNGIREMQCQSIVLVQETDTENVNPQSLSCDGGIGRHACDEAHYAEHVTIDKRLRLVMQGAKSLLTAFGFVGVATTNTSRLHRK